MPSPHSDPADWTRQLLGGLHSGDREAAEGLIERHTPELLSRARGMLARHPVRGHSEEDVVQLTWLRAFKDEAIKRFEHRGKGSLHGWLHRLQQRVVLDLQRESSTYKRGASVSQRSLDETVGEQALRAMVNSPDPTPSQMSDTVTSSALARAFSARGSGKSGAWSR